MPKINTKLSLDVALGSLKVLSDEHIKNTAQALGYTPKEWELLTGTYSWQGKDRPVVLRLLDQLLYGACDVMGLPRFDLPAEYAASCIALFIKTPNIFQACSWLSNFHSAEELGNFDSSYTTVDGLERCTSRQLFALVLMILSDAPCKKIIQNFNRKAKIGLEKMEGPNEPKK